MCVAEESDYITWIVNNISQDDIQPEGTNDVTYSSLPVSRVPNGSIIVCKARGRDGISIQSERVSFTLYRKSDLMKYLFTFLVSKNRSLSLSMDTL